MRMRASRPADRRQRGCFLLEAAPKRIRQDGKKRTKRPGDAFHVLHGGGDMKSFCQILALKIDVTRNSYLHIGYNLREFHEPNYLMLGIGYRFNNKRPKLF